MLSRGRLSAVAPDAGSRGHRCAQSLGNVLGASRQGPKRHDLAPCQPRRPPRSRSL